MHITEYPNHDFSPADVMLAQDRLVVAGDHLSDALTELIDAADNALYTDAHAGTFAARFEEQRKAQMPIFIGQIGADWFVGIFEYLKFGRRQSMIGEDAL